MNLKLFNQKIENIQTNLYEILGLVSVVKDSCEIKDLFEQETILEIIYDKLTMVTERLDCLNIKFYSELLKTKNQSH